MMFLVFSYAASWISLALRFPVPVSSSISVSPVLFVVVVGLFVVALLIVCMVLGIWPLLVFLVELEVSSVIVTSPIIFPINCSNVSGSW